MSRRISLGGRRVVSGLTSVNKPLAYLKKITRLPTNLLKILRQTEFSCQALYFHKSLVDIPRRKCYLIVLVKKIGICHEFAELTKADGFSRDCDQKRLLKKPPAFFVSFLPARGAQAGHL